MEARTALDDYLDGRAARDPMWTPEARPFLVLALRRAILNDNPALFVVRRSGPCWASARDPSSGTVERWNAGPEISAAIDHVRDWIVADVARSAPWLSRVDAEGRPLKLVKIGSLARAVAEADKAMVRHAAGVVRETLDDRHEVASADLGGGWSLVRLLSPEALDRESSFMQHCIGQGAYDALLKNDRFRFLSLRDPKNEPHATLDLRLLDDGARRLVQMSGKQNRRPVQRYLSILRPWLRENVSCGSYLDKLSNDDAWWSGWFVDVDGVRYEVSAPPADLRVSGSIEFDASAGASAPTVSLGAAGDVRISGDFPGMPARIVARLVRADPGSILRFGDGSSVEASDKIDFSDCRIEGAISLRAHHVKLENADFSHVPTSLASTALPFLGGTNLATVPIDVGSLDLHKTAIVRLPDDMTLRSLAVGGRRLRTLPKGLVVTEFLRLGHSPVERLPDDIVVEGAMTILDAHDSENRGIVLPEGLRIGGDLKVLSYPHGILPDGLRVGGDMVLDGSPDIGSDRRRHTRSFAGYRKELPKDLHVEGNAIIAARYVTLIPSCLVVRGCLVIHVGSSGLPVLEEGATIGRIVAITKHDGEIDVDPADMPRDEAERPAP